MLSFLRNCIFIFMLLFLLIMSLISPTTVTTISFAALFAITLVTAFIINIKDDEKKPSSSYTEDLQATRQ